jgi:hypothetical protein
MIKVWIHSKDGTTCVHGPLFILCFTSDHKGWEIMDNCCLPEIPLKLYGVGGRGVK